MVKKFFVLLITLGVILLFTGCNTSSEAENTAESPTSEENSNVDIGVENKIEEDPLKSPDRLMIEEFYDAAFEIYQISRDYEYGSLYATVSEHIKCIQEMTEYTVSEDSEYFQYIETMRNDVFVEQLVAIYSRNNGIDSYSMIESISADIFELCSEAILTEPLPFDFETQLMFETQQDRERKNLTNLAEIENSVLTRATDLMKAGADFVRGGAKNNGMSYYSTNEVSDIVTDYGSLTVRAAMDLVKESETTKDGCWFYFHMFFDDWHGENITNLTVNGVKFFSTQIDQLSIPGWSDIKGACFTTVIMFRSYDDPAMNEPFRAFQAVLKDSDRIEFVINDAITVVLDEKQTKEVKDLLVLVEYTESLFLAYQANTSA